MMESESTELHPEAVAEDGDRDRKPRTCKTRRSKKKPSGRATSFSRVTTSTPFTEIEFSHILHSRPKRSPFPPSHPLFVGLGPVRDSGPRRIKELITQILETRLDARRKGTAAAPCSNVCRRRLAALLTELLARRRRCRPSALLARRCGTGRIPPGVLASALRRLLRRLLPTDLLGPQRLDAPIRHLLSLGRFDVLCVGDVTRGLRLQGRAWLAGEPADAAVSLLGRVAVWAFNCLVLDVLRAYFYVTELLQPRMQLGFFLQRHWQSVSEKEVTQLASSGALNSLPLADAAADAGAGAVSGDGTGSTRGVVGRLRFIPKPSGALRPVCSLRASAAAKDRWAQLRAVLRLPQMGRDVTASDRRWLHERWLRFARARIREGAPLWYVRADVRDAYGSVSHTLLLRLLRERLAALPAQVELARRARGTGYTAWNGVGPKTTLPTTAVAEEMSALVTEQTVQFGKRRFRLARGLLQGGPLSGDLCDLYYDAALRRAVPWCFSEQRQEGLLLLRCVDDLLLLTDRRREAMRFLHRLKEGVAGQHARLNDAKTRSNVHGKDGDEVTFFGSVFNVKTLEVSPDCSCYQGTDMRYTFRTRQLRAPGQYLMKRLKYLATVRLTAIHWDPRLNSGDRLRRSLDAHLALTARRYVAMLSRLRLDQDERNTAFLARAAAFCWRRIAAALSRFARQGGFEPWARSHLVCRAGAAMFQKLLPPHLEQLKMAIDAEGRCRRSRKVTP